MRALIAILTLMVAGAAEAPRPVPPDRKLTAAAALIRKQEAQIRFQAFWQEVMQQVLTSPQQRELEAANQEFNALVEGLRAELGAAGCTLDNKWNWTGCPAPKEPAASASPPVPPQKKELPKGN